MLQQRVVLQRRSGDTLPELPQRFRRFDDPRLIARVDEERAQERTQNAPAERESPLAHALVEPCALVARDIGGQQWVPVVDGVHPGPDFSPVFVNFVPGAKRPSWFQTGCATPMPSI